MSAVQALAIEILHEVRATRVDLGARLDLTAALLDQTAALLARTDEHLDACEMRVEKIERT